ncbi:50S ribosomal protein L32e [Candidatus Woesearchaeota archaeon]|nr:50S ribosomal protein L32e [Candidatus Woesearchaeota archaeon]
MKTLLEVRKELKSRKPIFIRQDNPKRPKLNDKWRRPKGVHSKIRHHFKGRRKMPSPGYKSPAKVRGLHATGLQMIRVNAPEELKQIKKETQGIIIPENVGTKKRLEILRAAKQLDIKVLNLDSEEAIKKIEEFVNSKKKKIEAKGQKEEIKEKISATAKQTKEPTGQKTEQDEKETQPKPVRSQAEEKMEKDKILTKRM